MAATTSFVTYRGLSSDTKPTQNAAGSGPPAVGTRFIEIDTGDAYDWNGTAWIAAVATSTGDAGGTGGGGGTVAISQTAGENIVLAGTFLAVPTVSKTRPSDTNTYAIGDVVAESTSAATVWTFTSCVRASGGTGSLLGVLLTDTSKQSLKPQFDLWLFSATPTVQNDNVAFAPSAGDLANLVAVVNLASWTSANANGILQSTELNRPFKCVSSTSLYGVLVAANAYIPTSAEVLRITLQIGED